MIKNDNRTASNSDFVHLPPRTARLAAAEFRRRVEGRGAVRWGIKEMDDYLIPMLPGDEILIAGRPGHCKTSLCLHAVRESAAAISDPNEYVIYATWETLVEEFAGIISGGRSGYTLEDIGRGNVDLDCLIKATVSMVDTGIIVFGRSEDTAPGEIHDLRDLDIALKELQESGKTIKMVVVDYIQRVPHWTHQDDSSRVAANNEYCKNMALSHKIPFMVTAQARREVDDYTGLKMPTMRDPQWASNIEQTTDKYFGITMPIQYMKEGSNITVEGFKYRVSPSLVIVKVLKQRWGRSDGKLFLLDFDPRNARMTTAQPFDVVPEDSEIPF